MLSRVGQARYLLNHIHRIVACSSTGSIPGCSRRKIAGEVAGARGSEWLGEAFAPATLPAMHTVLRGFRRSETKLERGRGCNSLRLTAAVSVGTGFTGGGDGS